MIHYQFMIKLIVVHLLKLRMRVPSNYFGQTDFINLNVLIEYVTKLSKLIIRNLEKTVLYAVGKDFMNC